MTATADREYSTVTSTVRPLVSSIAVAVAVPNGDVSTTAVRMARSVGTPAS